MDFLPNSPSSAGFSGQNSGSRPSKAYEIGNSHPNLGHPQGKCPYMMFHVPLPEKALISRIRRQTGTKSSIGDDCAVLQLPPRHEMLVTTDFSLEGIHFRREWHPAESVGHRCLTRGLSDIAAMGGEPRAAFLSLALPRDLPQAWVDGFLRGLLRLAGKFSVTLAGGDTAQSPAGVLADIMVLGAVPKGKAILRSGARPGDRIYVTGELGGSAATLQRMVKNPKRKLRPADFPQHFFPKPRVQAGRFLRQKGLASALIDISDGLSTDLAHICEESGVGAEIQAEAIPREVALNLALHGGEDYELLFTAPRSKKVPTRISGVPITCIGMITRNRKIVLTENGIGRRLHPQGWEHFQ
jgi:thiamine-monophosphate kinase